MSTSNSSSSSSGRTVQEYIDETPHWPDGTPVPSAPMTKMQWRIWTLATAGKFFEGLVVFMTGVALPLIVKEFELGPTEKGAVGAAPLFGILIGATVLGWLSDRYGRKLMFIVEMILFVICLACLVFSPTYSWLLVFLFGMGMALGCDYPTAHMVISESIPSTGRGRLVLSAFGFQALGAMVGTAVGYVILYKNPELSAWRMMYATAILPAILVIVGRFYIPDSGHWLVWRGRIADAERETRRLLERQPPYPSEIKLIDPRSNGETRSVEEEKTHYGMLFSKKYRRATILASVPWFLQDLGTYGIGIFTPTILASVIGAEHKYAHNLMDIIANDMLAAKGAAFIDVLLFVGIVFAVLLVDRIGRIRLQIIGFIGCAAGLFLASLSVGAPGERGIIYIFSGFMLFNFMTNLGPNSMTYLLAGEVFPTHIRGKGAGFAASFAKIGAVLTAFLFPILLKDFGKIALLYVLIGASLLGALITWRFGIETKGISLESVHCDESVLLDKSASLDESCQPQ
ncbi:MFS transporter [Desulfovibrio inopinatus]|uniref:MFS transporter n=1 Tax=Desulfovibrio inopinatus TaxID=102109 RepID=UPI00042337FE|nr:MFS transporter [Desulfovibrio inopinatus]